MSDDTTTLMPSPQYITNRNGERIGVFIDLETYQRFIEDLEDLYDNQLMDEVEDEERTPWEEVRRKEDERRNILNISVSDDEKSQAILD